MIYFIMNEALVEAGECARSYSIPGYDVLEYLGKIGRTDIVAKAEYVIRIMDNKSIFYLKSRGGINHRFTEEELVVLRLAAQPL